jgi:hypothetical protein
MVTNGVGVTSTGCLAYGITTYLDKTLTTIFTGDTMLTLGAGDKNV